MTRQDLIHKWAVYALALLPVWLLDSCILPRFPLFGITPMLLPLALTAVAEQDRKSTRLNSSHDQISYAVFCLKKIFFFNDTATTEIYTLSLHDALPILIIHS